MNINSIEVNGEKFGLECVNSVHVSRTEPNMEINPQVWLKPASHKNLSNAFGMEKTLGSSSWQGDYTLDGNGNLVETTDTGNTATRTTKMFTVLRNNNYYIATSSTINDSTTQYLFAAYFYDKDKNFVSKSEFLTDLGVEYASYEPLLEFALPEGARYVRILGAINYITNANLIFSDISAEEKAALSDMYGGSSENEFYIWDEDGYVKM